jgi:uncharacterized protein (TIGR03083 family)
VSRPLGHSGTYVAPTSLPASGPADSGPVEDRLAPLVNVELRSQWAALRTWLPTYLADGAADLPSGLPGWSRSDLVAHLGFGLAMLGEVKAASSDARPLHVGEYMSRYRPAAADIAEATRATARGMTDVLDGIDELAERAWQALDSGLPPVILGRRGPIRRDHFLATRLVELVVHGLDIHHNCGMDVPLIPEAVRAAAAVLRDAYSYHVGTLPSSLWEGATSPDVLDDSTWILVSTGRLPSQDPLLPLL